MATTSLFSEYDDMRRVCFSILTAFFPFLLSISSSAHAAKFENASLKKIDTELKNVWSELDKLKPSKSVVSAKNGIKKALIESYMAQGKELKSEWLKKAPFSEISYSIKLQKLHQKKDFPYPASLYHLWVEKLSDESFKFQSRSPCIRLYLITKDSPDYKLCLTYLSGIKNDNEYHQVPSDFPRKILDRAECNNSKTTVKELKPDSTN